MKSLNEQLQKKLIIAAALNDLNQHDFGQIATYIEWLERIDDIDIDFILLDSPLNPDDYNDEKEALRDIMKVLSKRDWEQFPFPYIFDELQGEISNMVEAEEWEWLYEIFSNSTGGNMTQKVAWELMSSEERERQPRL